MSVRASLPAALATLLGAAIALVVIGAAGGPAAPPRSSGSTPAASAGSTATPSAASATGPTSTPSVTLQPTLPSDAFRAPAIPWPLPQLDPGLANRGPRPTLAQLATFLYGSKPLLSYDPSAGPADWRLSRPSMSAVAGYADAVSVAPGGTIGLHLAGADPVAQVDMFRLGVGDATHVLSVPSVRVSPMVIPTPARSTGLDQMGWPTSYRLRVPTTWRSGVYLAKLSARDGQSYVLFIVRPPHPTGLVVMIPTLTYQAYNSWDHASLYHWDGAPHGSPSRAYAVSFDRPYAWEGAGLLFRTELPLIVWLEDHGYSPGYISDVDLALDPSWATGARTLVIAGHAEYWTASMRSAVLAAESRGVGVVAFGGNLAYWQVRLASDAAGRPARTVVCYKSASLDPLAARQPQLATVQFRQLPVPEPASQLFGADYAGMVKETGPLVLTNAIATFAPEIGLRPGERLPALLGGEIDSLVAMDRGVALTQSPAATGVRHVALATGSLWLGPGGAHVFDAGTFAWSWGLDPRYAAALPGFPATAFSRLTAEILAWAGTRPA